VVVATVLVEVAEVVVVPPPGGTVVVVVDDEVFVTVTVLGPTGVLVSQAAARPTITNPISSGLRIACMSGIGNSSVWRREPGERLAIRT
jgi:hypothetical protein